MDIHRFLPELRAHLTQSFAAVDAWFEQPAALRAFRPADLGWTGDEVLAHVALTNHYLLILIRKGTRKARAAAEQPGRDLAAEVAAYEFDPARLAAVGVLRAFPWVRPAHMEPPHPLPPPATVRQQLRQQLAEVLDCLRQLPHGEGVLHRTTMSVDNLGKLNVYEYLYFLAQHAQRHCTQLSENAAEYAATTTGP